MQTAYLYDEVTKEFLGTKDIYEDKFFDYNLPAYATWVENTLTPGDNEVAIFNETTELWELEDDYRGALWYLKADGSLVTFALGDTPNTTTMTNIPKPSVNADLFIWDTGNDPSLDYTFITDVALTGTAPLIQDGNDLTGVTNALVRLSGQTNPAEDGYYDYVESMGNYTLTPNTVWIYDLPLTRSYQKKVISNDANANIASLLEDGLNGILDVVVYAFARIDGFNYESVVPTPNATIAINVALSGTLPNPNGLNNGDVVKLTGQTDPTENGYYDYQETGPNYTLTPLTFPETPFYDGVKTENGLSTMESHEIWNGPSGGAAGYLGIFAERKRVLMADIDAAATGEDILAINWTNM